jgi:S-DNA-T family DNA segregation ATPase FtsK/SpoIIIE
MSHQYKELPDDQLQDLFSTFLIDSWSYSKVSQFARNEKAFEMQHIYGLYGKLSVSSIAGNAYHSTIEYYFTNLKDGLVLPLVELEAAAFQYLNGVAANKWKLGKTTPTVEEAMIKATKTVVALLKNFYQEKALYEDDVAEILYIETKGSAWVTCNGVDIPLPCHFKIDMVVRLKTGEVVIIDHKSKSAFTNEDEAVLSIGVQAMTYVLCLEETKGLQVSEVWFMENKYSQNKDKSAQLVRIPVKITPDTRRLYEALLYEPVKRMISAVRDPDYIYLINESDNFADKAEIYDFWCRTMLNEFSVDSFNIDDAKKELVSKRLKKVRDSALVPVSLNIIRQFKEKAATFIQYDLSVTNMSAPQKIEHALKTFGVQSEVSHTFEGFSSNTYLLSVSAGVKVGSIHKYRLDIANALDVENVRISENLVRHEGKSYLSIDVSKKCDKILPFTPSDRQGWKIPLGKDNFGNVIVWDIDNPATPHALICGQTGSGKSVEIFNIIEHVVEAGAKQVIILDPKYEFEGCRAGNVDVVNSIEEIEWTMFKLVQHMNKLVFEGRKESIIVIFDEFADALANSRKGKALEGEKSLEENLRILAQKGRSCGIRICAATQRASVKIITGDTKVNFPVQICFRVNKEADSRVILDEAGAESLSGKGDGLIKSPEYQGTVRFQAYFKPQNITA